ncbi:Ca-activated chloride channel family protein [Catalinimonas alkaloidigena]|uniref:Ca-activated chloride channel family protein n=1 Tax=Catalinimonas alkaloidigena TaxID=1075417 RepID=A0A1G8ZUG4_9BACT|nr:hypothetical protein [Catalinimonas alkaloidigena]SDK17995.1 Ca-activated chloride channel family protein [Catalinimonas alkaloidigena]
MKFFLFAVAFFASLSAWAQNVDASFHAAANQYINGNKQEALATVETALRRYPDDAKLNALYNKLQDENQQDQQQQQQQGDQKQEDQENQQNQPQQQQQGQQQEQQEGEQQEKPSEEQSGKDPQQQEEQPQEGEEGDDEKEASQAAPINQEQLDKLNISEEKARMILDAMRDSEIQYLQQKKHRNSKGIDPNKPDW